ncbi:MAG: S41 family peptidase, partial [Bacillota bacterium]|nr:S41 family peptidase [Bacillota bacterium]
GRSTEEMSVDEAVTLMRGPKGTAVQLRLRRGGTGREYEVQLVREIIKVPRVEAKMLPDRIGYIKLAGFSETSVQDLDRALAELDRQRMAGLILDLRYNPGGLMNIAVEIAQRFIQEGPILYVSGRNQRERQSFYASGRASHPDLPMVVLVNQGSASASEILAGALKDHKRALLVGTKTFGKGLVQTIIPLHDGSALSLTTQKWFTAGGHSIALEGITPDVVVKNPGDDEMARELEKIKRREEGAAGKEQEQAGPEQNPAPKAAGAEAGRDYQLERAVQLLKERLAEQAERRELRKAS